MTFSGAQIDERMMASLWPADGDRFPLEVFRVRGSQRDMGAQLGALSAAAGAPLLSDHYADLPRRLILGAGGGDTAERIAFPALAPLLERAVRTMEVHRPREFRERSRAFSEALGEPADQSRYTSIMDLFQNVVALAFRLGLPALARRLASVAPGCSTLMAWGDRTSSGRLLHARNFDFPGIGLWERRPTVVFCTPTEGLRYGYVSTLGGDLPGITAFNEAGLVVTAHTRFHANVRFRGTGIVDLGHAIVKRAKTLADAVSVVRSLAPIASTWGIAVSSARERAAISIETSGSAVDVVHAEQRVLTCANRYHHPRLTSAELVLSPGFVASSTGREAALRGLFEDGPIDRSAAAAALGSYVDADSRAPRAAGPVLAQGCSVQSIVADADEHEIDVSVGPCPTGLGPWQSVAWNWEGAEHETLFESRAPITLDAVRVAAGHLVEATRLAECAASLAPIRAHVERAVALCPNDPSYRFAAGLFAARAGQLSQAAEHLDCAIANERSSYGVAQACLWRSRVADALGEREVAEALRQRIRPEGLHVEAIRLIAAEADADRRRPFGPSTLKHIKIALEALDAG